MKKWMYVISVGGMLAIFLFFYFSHIKEAEQQEKIRQEKLEQDRKAEAAKKAEIEAKARADAERRAAERAAADAKKEAEKVAKWEAENRHIQEETDGYNAKANAYAKQASELDIQLTKLRAEKDRLIREAFEFAKQVEQARIEKRNAELEIQRMTDMISKKAADSSLTRAPVMPTPKPST